MQHAREAIPELFGPNDENSVAGFFPPLPHRVLPIEMQVANFLIATSTINLLKFSPKKITKPVPRLSKTPIATMARQFFVGGNFKMSVSLGGLRDVELHDLNES